MALTDLLLFHAGGRDGALESGVGGLVVVADHADAGRHLAEWLPGFPAGTSWCWTRHGDRDTG